MAINQMDCKKMLETAVEIESLLRRGYNEPKIRKEVKGFSPEILSIAKAKITNNKIVTKTSSERLSLKPIKN